MIVCNVILYAAATDEGRQVSEWSGRMWFRRVPCRNEMISLDRDSDWPSHLRGGRFVVAEVVFAQSKPEDQNPPLPGIGAVRRR